MSEIVVVMDNVQEGSDCSDVGVICRGDGRTMLTHSFVSGVVLLDIFERRTGVSIYSTSFAAGTAGPLYDVPQVDDYWGLDLIGYNWRYLPTVAALALQGAAWLGGRTYDHIYRIPTSTDGIIRAVFRRTIDALPV